MMTPAEVRLLMERRADAIRWTIAEMTAELLRLEADMPRRNHGSDREEVPESGMERG